MTKSLNEMIKYMSLEEKKQIRIICQVFKRSSLRNSL
jgi:hypothetical protein